MLLQLKSSLQMLWPGGNLAQMVHTKEEAVIGREENTDDHWNQHDCQDGWATMYADCQQLWNNQQAARQWVSKPRLVAQTYNPNWEEGHEHQQEQDQVNANDVAL